MGRAEIIAQTEHTLIKMCFFCTVCRKSNLSHSSGHVQFDYHLSDILLPLVTAVLEGVKMFSLYDVIGLVGHDLVLCLLPLRRSQYIDWSRYVCNDPPVLVTTLRRARCSMSHCFLLTGGPRQVDFLTFGFER